MNRDELRAWLTEALERYEQTHEPLPGIVASERRAALVEQLVESVRRTHYLEHIASRPGGPIVANPTDIAFNPLRAAMLQDRAGNRDEAFWLVFLFVHFGKNKRSGWHLIADVYGRCGSGTLWSWAAVSADVRGFRRWLDDNVDGIKSRKPRRAFGNHRKYESLDAWSHNGTGGVVASYVDWVGPDGHGAHIAQVMGGAPTAAERFDALFASARTIHRFGRTAAFDYCSTLARLGLLDIEPSAACLVGATGPLKGARLLLCGTKQSLTHSELDALLAPLEAELDVGYDVLEDALCNWQKSPDKFKPFRG